MPLSAIFFDVGQTLCFADFPAILAPLHRRGIFPSEELWKDTLRATKPILDQEHSQSALHAPDRSFWQMYYDHLLAALGLPTEGDSPEALANLALRDELTHLVRQSAHWNKPPIGTLAVLQRLGERYKLGVISNADGHIEAMLRQCGLADCFLNFTDSGLTGMEKPDPRIFQIALERMGCPAEESLYVGDIYSVDYQGATAVGMKAVIMDAAGVYRDTSYPRIESLLQLEGWLETHNF